MSYLARLDALLSEKGPDQELTEPTEPGFVSCVSAGAGDCSSNRDLPATLLMGLHRLRASQPPRRVRDESVWREIVADALALRDAGWAAAALALGWSPLDLFGHSDRRDGLAIWLRRRPILLIDAASAIVDNGDGVRGGYYRCRDGMPGATLLWEIGQ